MSRQILGTYRAQVVDTRDPLKLHRVTLYVPQILGHDTTGWAEPHKKISPEEVPSAGDQVFVFFAGGDPQKPIYLA